MNPHDQRIIHSSEDPNWRTPRGCYAMLDREFRFDVDAAADLESAFCLDYFGPGGSAENALTEPWAGHTISGEYDYVTAEAFFLNPPFSRTLAAAYKSGRIKRGGAWVEHPIDLLKAQSYEIENWVRKCWEESQKGPTIVGLIPFAPQTEWYRRYVYGHAVADRPADQPPAGLNVKGGIIEGSSLWSGHAAMEERRLPHRISFLRPDGSAAANAGVNTAIIVWKPGAGIVGPWQPHQFYWSYR